MSEEKDLTFGQAMAELEAILSGIEDESIDIDTLAQELQRASKLLETARAKLRRAETEVRQIVSQIDADDASALSDNEDL